MAEQNLTAYVLSSADLDQLDELLGDEPAVLLQSVDKRVSFYLARNVPAAALLAPVMERHALSSNDSVARTVGNNSRSANQRPAEVSTTLTISTTRQTQDTIKLQQIATAHQARRTAVPDLEDESNTDSHTTKTTIQNVQGSESTVKEVAPLARKQRRPDVFEMAKLVGGPEAFIIWRHILIQWRKAGRSGQSLTLLGARDQIVDNGVRNGMGDGMFGQASPDNTVFKYFRDAFTRADSMEEVAGLQKVIYRANLAHLMGWYHRELKILKGTPKELLQSRIGRGMGSIAKDRLYIHIRPKNSSWGKFRMEDKKSSIRFDNLHEKSRRWYQLQEKFGSVIFVMIPITTVTHTSLERLSNAEFEKWMERVAKNFPVKATGKATGIVQNVGTVQERAFCGQELPKKHFELENVDETKITEMDCDELKELLELTVDESSDEEDTDRRAEMKQEECEDAD